jgi:hypothetical protein
MRPVMAMTGTGPHGEERSVAPEPVFEVVVTADGEGTLVVRHGHPASAKLAPIPARERLGGSTPPPRGAGRDGNRARCLVDAGRKQA